MLSRVPRVSIGIPVYNGGKYLEKAIQSILAQTFTDFEIIISDNCSTDQTQEICMAYASKDTRICYSRNSKNLGAAPNYNRVFELSSGEYFKWADYDDLITPDFLTKCVDVLDEHPDVVLCYPLSRVIDENGDFLGDYSYKARADSPAAHIRFRDFTLNPDAGFQVSGLIRSDAIRKTVLHGSYPASDLVFLAELSLIGRLFELPEYLFLPRYHPDQSTKGAQKVERDRVFFFDTSNAGKISLPKWSLLAGFLRAIRESSIGGKAKVYCYVQMVRWIFIPDHFRALGKDVLLAILKLSARIFSKVRNTTQQAT